MRPGPITRALLSCFDEVEERRIVRNLITQYEDALEKQAKQFEETVSRLTSDAEALRIERDFYRDQFEQVQTRIEKLQGSL